MGPAGLIRSLGYEDMTYPHQISGWAYVYHGHQQRNAFLKHGANLRWSAPRPSPVVAPVCVATSPRAQRNGAARRCGAPRTPGDWTQMVGLSQKGVQYYTVYPLMGYQ